MQTTYQQMGTEELEAACARLDGAVDRFADRGLSLDMARGKPSREQVDISRPMLGLLGPDADLTDGGVDCGNYGCFEGIPSARVLAAGFLGLPAAQCLVMGSSSLQIMHGAVSMCWARGVGGHEPWAAQAARGPVSFLCPSPGYDRHFGITEAFGIRNVPVPMTPDGPDMDAVEELAADPSVKGIWCVPKYQNPTGVTFSDEVVRRFAEMRPAAPDFRVFWDNAYCVHDLYEDGDELADVFSLAAAAGTADRFIEFASTSKITFPGAGIAFAGGSPATVAELSSWFKGGLISGDKLNQLRHARFLPNMGAVRAHMRRHAGFLRPRFELVRSKLEEGLGGTGCATWTDPRGGYFVSFDGPRGSARRIVALCARMGVKLTPAGATWPGGADPDDTNIRIAPSFPSLEDLGLALDALVLATKAVSARLALEERREGASR